MPITALIPSRSTLINGELRPAEVMRRFEGLKELRACMWDGFEDHPMRKDYVEPNDYEYEPTPHDSVLAKAAQARAMEGRE